MGSDRVLSSVDLTELRVVLYPDPVLRKRCRPVSDFGPKLEALALRMLELMHADRGVGLAAPQVGLLLRLFVCNPTGKPEDDRAYANPELSDLEGSVEANEGCLSLPEVTVPMRRAPFATLVARDPLGKELRLRGTDLEARVWQHETDHLEGRLIIDHVPTSAELANRRILKQLRADYQGRKKRRVPSRCD